MKTRVAKILLLPLITMALPALAETRVVDLQTSDGINLKASYTSPGHTGPGMLLIHQCNMDRSSWKAISTYRLGASLKTKLPINLLASKLGKLDLLDVHIDHTGTSGNYLSGFMGLHGLYYNRIEPHNLTAGHIHVGRNVSVDEATTMMEATLEIVLKRFPASMACQH